MDCTERNGFVVMQKAGLVAKVLCLWDWDSIETDFEMIRPRLQPNFLGRELTKVDCLGARIPNS